MNLYTILKEDSLLNEFKEKIIPKVHKIQNYIDEYRFDSSTLPEKEITLKYLLEELDLLNIDFKNIGYDYTPEVVPDVDEDTFISSLEKYKEDLSHMLNNFNEDYFESYSTQIRYFINLIDIHRANLVNI